MPGTTMLRQLRFTNLAAFVQVACPSMKRKNIPKGIDPHPLVGSLSAQRGPWQVTSGPTGRGH